MSSINQMNSCLKLKRTFRALSYIFSLLLLSFKMISKYNCVLLVMIVYMFCFHTMSTKLKFLLANEKSVLRCSEHRYLIFDDWLKLLSMNIHCPNQFELFENYPPVLIEELNFFVACSNGSSVFSIIIKFDYVKMNGESKKNPCKNVFKWTSHNPLKYLRGRINDSNQELEFTARCNDSQVLIDLGSHNLLASANPVHTFYLKFDTQPAVCRIIFNQTGVAEDGKCLPNFKSTRNLLCCYLPTSKEPLGEMDWYSISNFFLNVSYAPHNWHKNGGYYYDDQLVTDSVAASVRLFPYVIYQEDSPILLIL